MRTLNKKELQSIGAAYSILSWDTGYDNQAANNDALLATLTLTCLGVAAVSFSAGYRMVATLPVAVGTFFVLSRFS